MPHNFGTQTHYVNPIKLVYTNTCSLFSKLPELTTTKLVAKPQIIAVTETWLQTDISMGILHFVVTEVIDEGLEFSCTS